MILAYLEEIIKFILPLLYLGAGTYLLASAGVMLGIVALFVARIGSPKI